jgi:hypothetical protein
MENLPIILTGSYKVPKGDGEALHSFDRRKKDNFGGHMLIGSPIPAEHISKVKLDQGKGVNQVLTELIAQGIKPDITKIDIKVNDDYTVNWSVTIDESKDGKAYAGLSTRGSVGGGSDSRALSQLNDLKANNPNLCHWAVVLDLNVTKPMKIRQYFLKYTKCNPNEKANDITTTPVTTNIEVKLESDTPPPPEPKTPDSEIKLVSSLNAEVDIETPIKVLSLDGEFLFNIETNEFFIGNKNVGDLFIIGKGEIYDKVVDSEVGEEYTEEAFQGSEELAAELEIIQSLQLESLPPNPTPTTESLERVDDINIDFNNPKYVGDKWKSFNIDSIINLLPKEYKPSNDFKESLKTVLYFIKNDSSIDQVKKAAYLLGTAFAESGYSLQRWESDYACGKQGVKYGSNGPCSSALNYYKSTKGGKLNYYNLGTDSKGFPYFGRGLIQLTGKGNYKSYGQLLNIDLLGNGDLAMVPQNSYKIAVEFMKGNQGTFKKVLNGDLTAARRSVNGGRKGLDEVNGAYKAWLNAFDKVGVSV